MGSIPPYGYMRDPGDKHKLIIDEDVRDVVKDCFCRYAVGESMRQIAMDLTERGVLSPKSYYYSRIGGSNPKSYESPTWSSNAIRQMLHNQVYIGNMVQGMRVSLSFKSKQRIFTSPEQWVAIENTHEAVIAPDTWEAVQKRLALKGTTRNRVSTENNQLSLFSGLVVCADCGSKLAFTTKHNKNSTVCLYRCVRYNMHGKDVCTSHRITEDYLSQIVLNDIRINAKLAEKDEEALKTQIRHLLQQQQGYAERSVQKEIDVAQSRLAALVALINKLMEDRCAGNISDSMFRKLMSGYEKEQIELEASFNALRECASSTEQKKSDVSKWTNQIRKYTEITELDRNVVTTLIEKIKVSEKYNVDGKTYQDVQIQYKFVGSVQMVEEIPATQSA